MVEGVEVDDQIDLLQPLQPLQPLQLYLPLKMLSKKPIKFRPKRNVPPSPVSFSRGRKIIKATPVKK